MSRMAERMRMLVRTTGHTMKIRKSINKIVKKPMAEKIVALYVTRLTLFVVRIQPRIYVFYRIVRVLYGVIAAVERQEKIQEY